MPPRELEPIFSRQEQGVVYLFSRYWDKIPEFKDKTILRIHTHFPDFSIMSSDGRPEAIEFEYGLHDFSSHLGKCLKKLNREGCRRLYIVYWDDTGDKKGLCRKIKEKGFKGKVECLCLKEYFTAFVSRLPDKGPWHAAWKFSERRDKPTPAYPTATIKNATDVLESEGAVRRLPINSSLYRTIGFDKSGSDFIECDHWRSIHFFRTTTRFQADSIPCKLFVKPNGCKYFDGYFEIERAFKIAKLGEATEQFFKDYYFYEHDDYPEEKSTCFVYSDFKLLARERGKKLFAILEKKYTLGVRGSIKINPEDNAVIDRVVRE